MRDNNNVILAMVTKGRRIVNKNNEVDEVIYKSMQKFLENKKPSDLILRVF